MLLLSALIWKQQIYISVHISDLVLPYIFEKYALNNLF